LTTNALQIIATQFYFIYFNKLWRSILMSATLTVSGARDAYKRTEIEGKKYYGKHLMLTAISCNENLLDIPTISRFIKEMVPAIDMVPYGDLTIARFGEGIEVGISAVQLIVTSAITIHTNDNARDLYLDVFSCKWYDESIVLDMVKKYFNPQNINDSVILRR
jgi:S-adenosylmethionine/arginine decarboxylase-like enzyme